jgi:hypothetical protein
MEDSPRLEVNKERTVFDYTAWQGLLKTNFPPEAQGLKRRGGCVLPPWVTVNALLETFNTLLL